MVTVKNQLGKGNQHDLRWTIHPGQSLTIRGRFASLWILGLLGCAEVGPRDPFLVVSDGLVGPNIAVGMDSSTRLHDWVTRDNDHDLLRLDYPEDQDWGLVQFWLRLDIPDQRPSEDFSEFQTIQMLLDGDWSAADTTVNVGIRGATNLSNDAIALAPLTIQLPPHGANEGPIYYVVPLAQFDRPGLPSPRAKLTSPSEFHFNGASAVSVQIHDITLFKEPSNCGQSVCAKGN